MWLSWRQTAGPGDPITYDNMARAIGAFERTLMTPSPFDAFIAGNDAALSDEQLAGLETFLSAGCITMPRVSPTRMKST